MLTKTAPRILLTGTSSGCGKTTITCGLISALRSKIAQISSFKCGPDYIDPIFHQKILEIPSYNLDSFFYDESTLTYLFANRALDFSVIEGVMGYFDGRTVSSLEGSSYEISKILNIPSILIVNCKGTAHSILPVIQGFLAYQKEHCIQGVILNHISKETFTQLSSLIKEKIPDHVKLVGYIPKLPDNLTFQSRHLGLITPADENSYKNNMAQLGELLSTTLDLDSILEIGNAAPKISYETVPITPIVKDIHISVAKDPAFSFYYEENLNLLERLGCKLNFFSPTNDKELPENTDGIYLGGGYPELFVKQLSENTTMKSSIYEKLMKNTPCVAECGGFLYLTKEIDGFPMVGYVDTQSFRTNKLSTFGYVTLSQEKSSLLGDYDTEIRAHEFHYYQCEENGSDFTVTKPNGKIWKTGKSTPYFYGGFPHLPFYQNIEVPKNFVQVCQTVKKENMEKNNES